MFLHCEHGIDCRIPPLPSSYYVCAVVEEMCKCMLRHALSELPHQQIFDKVTISISCYEEQWVWQQLLGRIERWMAAVSCSIGVLGAVHL